MAPNYTPRPPMPTPPATAVRSAVLPQEPGMSVDMGNPTYASSREPMPIPPPRPIPAQMPVSAAAQAVPRGIAVGEPNPATPMSTGPRVPGPSMPGLRPNPVTKNPRATLMANLPPGAKAIIDARMQTNRTARRPNPIVKR